MVLTFDDPWPEDVKRAWRFTFRYRAITGAYLVETVIAHETKRVNETFMRHLMEQCIKLDDGWKMNSMIAKRHFRFEKLPPYGASFTAFERLIL